MPFWPSRRLSHSRHTPPSSTASLHQSTVQSDRDTLFLGCWSRCLAVWAQPAKLPLVRRRRRGLVRLGAGNATDGFQSSRRTFWPLVHSCGLEQPTDVWWTRHCMCLDWLFAGRSTLPAAWVPFTSWRSQPLPPPSLRSTTWEKPPVRQFSCFSFRLRSANGTVQFVNWTHFGVEPLVRSCPRASSSRSIPAAVSALTWEFWSGSRPLAARPWTWRGGHELGGLWVR